MKVKDKSAPKETTQNQRRKRKFKRNKATKDSVLKMLLVMSEKSPDTCRDVTQDFLTTGRAGRRNALPDILGEHALTSTSDLPDRLQFLTTNDDPVKTGESSQTSGQSSSSQLTAATGSPTNHDVATHSSSSSQS